MHQIQNEYHIILSYLILSQMAELNITMDSENLHNTHLNFRGELWSYNCGHWVDNWMCCDIISVMMLFFCLVSFYENTGGILHQANEKQNNKRVAYCILCQDIMKPEWSKEHKIPKSKKKKRSRMLLTTTFDSRHNALQYITHYTTQQ